MSVIYVYVLSARYFFGQILPVIHMIFYITFHFLYCSTMLLHSLFRMGESDYLYDNLSAVAILRKRKIYFSFYSFGANCLRLACASEIQFLWRLFDEILIHRECSRLPRSFLAKKTAGYEPCALAPLRFCPLQT